MLSALCQRTEAVSVTMQAVTRIPATILYAVARTLTTIVTFATGICDFITATITYPFHVALAVRSAPQPPLILAQLSPVDIPIRSAAGRFQLPNPSKFFARCWRP